MSKTSLLAPPLNNEVARDFAIVRSPLRYPGGKSRAVSIIRSYIPENVIAICSPFLGGASVELSCAADGMRVYGSDAFKPVTVFWQQATKNSSLLAERVKKYYPLSKRKFYELQKSYDSLTTDIERAAVFFVLNRSSFSGTTLSGGMSPNHPRFTKSAIERVRDFQISRLFVRHSGWQDALMRHPDKFLYLDPPYANGGNLYGNRGDMHDGFNHEELAEVLHNRDGWVLSYNDCDLIQKLYQGFEVVRPEWTYGMSNNKKSNEVLIVNA